MDFEKGANLVFKVSVAKAQKKEPYKFWIRGLSLTMVSKPSPTGKPKVVTMVTHR